MSEDEFGVRRQSEAATALWIKRDPCAKSKAVSRYACHRTPKAANKIMSIALMRGRRVSYAQRLSNSGRGGPESPWERRRARLLFFLAKSHVSGTLIYM